MMQTQLIEVGRQRRLGKFLALATICAYPKYKPFPFRKEDLWIAYPEEANEPQGLAKRCCWPRPRLIGNSMGLMPSSCF